MVVATGVTVRAEPKNMYWKHMKMLSSLDNVRLAVCLYFLPAMLNESGSSLLLIQLSARKQIVITKFHMCF